jgi:hypothetical protein
MAVSESRALRQKIWTKALPEVPRFVALAFSGSGSDSKGYVWTDGFSSSS